jgi:hypothetical protein
MPVPMTEHHDIDFIFHEWPYQPGVISARLVRAHDGREVLQMRIEMGLLQMETTGRPDGQRPGGAETFLAHMQSQLGKGEMLSEEQCFEFDREFLQFYHRRICCLALREFARAVTDADHTLAMMDFILAHVSDEQYALSHTRYRSFVHFHRAQAATMAALEQRGPEAAIEEINAGLEQLRKIGAVTATEGQFGEEELVGQLEELKESLRKEYHVGQTLAEQLADAVAAEEYERAARLRDQIARRGQRHA